MVIGLERSGKGQGKVREFSGLGRLDTLIFVLIFLTGFLTTRCDNTRAFSGGASMYLQKTGQFHCRVVITLSLKFPPPLPKGPFVLVTSY